MLGPAGKCGRSQKQRSPMISFIRECTGSGQPGKTYIYHLCADTGVRGNGIADSAAKSALDLKPDKSRIPYTDLKPKINKFLHTKWQQQWSNSIHNKLFQIQPTLGEWRPASRKSRRKQAVISRLRIGHTRFTHSFILKQEPQPHCLTCHTTCTVKHILIECRNFVVIRKRFFKVNNSTDLFENVKIDDILSFLRETELYQKIWQLKTG